MQRRNVNVEGIGSGKVTRPIEGESGQEMVGRRSLPNWNRIVQQDKDEVVTTLPRTGTCLSLDSKRTLMLDSDFPFVAEQV